MEKVIKNSQVADRNSSINNSKNSTNISIRKIRKESIIISFIVGTLSSIIASIIYNYFF